MAKSGGRGGVILHSTSRVRTPVATASMATVDAALFDAIRIQVYRHFTDTSRVPAAMNTAQVLVRLLSRSSKHSLHSPTRA